MKASLHTHSFLEGVWSARKLDPVAATLLRPGSMVHPHMPYRFRVFRV